MDRDIVVFGYDNDPDKAEFHRKTIHPKYDLKYVLNQEIDALNKACSHGFLVKEHKRFVSIIIDSVGDIYDMESFYIMADADRFVHRNGGGYVYDLDEERAIRIKPRIWKDRNAAKDVSEAMCYISEYIANRFFYLDDESLNEIKEYASKNNIPFSADLMSYIVYDINDLYSNRWNSSNC